MVCVVDIMTMALMGADVHGMYTSSWEVCSFGRGSGFGNGFFGGFGFGEGGGFGYGHGGSGFGGGCGRGNDWGDGWGQDDNPTKGWLWS